MIGGCKEYLSLGFAVIYRANDQGRGVVGGGCLEGFEE